MGRILPRTPCADAPWIKAPAHGTASAYNRHGCRCTSAVEARGLQRQAYDTSAKGLAARERRLAAQRAALRGPDGLTATERRVRDRTARARELLARPGATISWVAKIMGLHERTIRIYAGKVDA
jgi:DNA-binding CsgD family transcriptional regulator